MTSAEAERMEVMALEGSLREMPLADVLQLLELGRRTAVLRVEDARAGRAATILMNEGRIASARAHSIDEAGSAPFSNVRGDPRRAIVDAMCDVLAWTSGRFSVAPLAPNGADAQPAARRAGVAVDAVLLEAAHRADEWGRLADRLPGSDAVPTLALLPEGEALTLSPEEWRILAVADGALDVRAIAARLQRDVLAVAGDVHRLLTLGVLCVDRVVEQDVPTGDAQSSMK